MHFELRTLLSSLILLFLHNANAQSYQKIHQRALVVDTHNDILTACLTNHYSFDQDLKGKTHSDIERFRQGGIDVQIFSIWCDGLMKDPFSYANKQIDTLYATITRNPGKISLVTSAAELQSAVHSKKLAAMIGVEGGHMIENDLSKLDSLFKRGARYMTLTWNNSTAWATSAYDETLKKDLD